MRLLTTATLCLALACGGASRSFAASVSTAVHYDQSGPGGYQTSARTDEVAGPASNSLITASGSGTAYAEIGLLRVGAVDSPLTVPIHTINSTRTEAVASWNDLITLTAPGAATGVVTFRLDLSAVTSVSGAVASTGIASTDVVLAINGVNYLEASSVRGFPNVPASASIYRIGQGTTVLPGTEISGSYFVDVPFASGIAFSLRVQSLCSAFSFVEIQGFGPVGYGGADCDMTHTARWGGISAIVGAGGAPLTNYAIGSQSGFDYAAHPASEVPEPASWATLMLGFAVVGSGLRRRRLRVARAA